MTRQLKSLLDEASNLYNSGHWNQAYELLDKYHNQYHHDIEYKLLTAKCAYNLNRFLHIAQLTDKVEIKGTKNEKLLRLRLLSLLLTFQQDKAENLMHELLANGKEMASWSAAIASMHYVHSFDSKKLYKSLCSFETKFNVHPRMKFDHLSKVSPTSPVKIGILSSEFRNHSVFDVTNGWIRSFRTEKIHIYVFYNHPTEDEYSNEIKSHVYSWHNIFGMSDRSVIDIIRKNNIEIIMDLTWHTGNNRLSLLLHKPAPVQISYIQANTSGLSTVDYRFTDEWTDPPGYEQINSESLIRLKEGHHVFYSRYGEPKINHSSVQDRPIVFGCFADMNKLNEPLLEAWAKILNRLPGSRLLLKNRSFSDPDFHRIFQSKMQQIGLSPEQLILLGYSPIGRVHMDIYNKIDILLDTYPFNSVTTTCEALWMGVPVVTITGQHHTARRGASLLNQVGLQEYIAADWEQYLEIAVNLASDPNTLSTLHLELRNMVKRSSLYDGPSMARQMEDAFFQMRRTIQSIME